MPHVSHVWGHMTHAPPSVGHEHAGGHHPTVPGRGDCVLVGTQYIQYIQYLSPLPSPPLSGNITGFWWPSLRRCCLRSITIQDCSEHKQTRYMYMGKGNYVAYALSPSSSSLLLLPPPPPPPLFFSQAVMRELLPEMLPRLNAHLQEYAIDVTLVTFNWFLTLFIDAMPTEVC